MLDFLCVDWLMGAVLMLCTFTVSVLRAITFIVWYRLRRAIRIWPVDYLYFPFVLLQTCRIIKSEPFLAITISLLPNWLGQLSNSQYRHALSRKSISCVWSLVISCRPKIKSLVGFIRTYTFTVVNPESFRVVYPFTQHFLYAVNGFSNPQLSKKTMSGNLRCNFDGIMLILESPHPFSSIPTSQSFHVLIGRGRYARTD